MKHKATLIELSNDSNTEIQIRIDDKEGYKIIKINPKTGYSKVIKNKKY